MKMTKAIIYAAAQDAYTRAKRRGDQQAEDAYYNEFGRLYQAIGGAGAWIDLPAR